jgi:hypothetical protein
VARNVADNPKIVELTPEEWDVMFDQRCRELLGISGREFLRRYSAGAYDAIIDAPQHPEIMHLAMLRPR